jgi:hypothetical protein
MTDKTIAFKVDAEDHKALMESAAKAGITLSEYVRLALGINYADRMARRMDAKAAQWASEAVEVKARMKEVARLTAEQAAKDND